MIVYNIILSDIPVNSLIITIYCLGLFVLFDLL